MGLRTGRDYKIGIAKDNPRGTATVPSFWIPRKEFDFEDKVQTVMDEQGLGVIEDVSGHRVVAQWAEGVIGGHLKSKPIGLLLLNMLGQVDTAGVGDPYTHTFIVKQDHVHPSLTISVEDPEGDKAFPLAMLKSLKIVAAINEYVLFSGDYISKKSEALAVTPAYEEDIDFIASEATIKFADTQAGLDAADAVNCSSTEITMEAEIDKDDVLGSVDPADLNNKAFKATISVVRTMSDATYKDLWKAGTAKAFRLFLTDGGTPVRSLQIDLNKVLITNWTSARGLDDKVVETIEMKAAFKIADSKMITAILKNAQASY